MSSWTDLFCREKDSYIKVEITDAEEQMLSKVAHRMESKQNTEYVYTFDNKGIGTRWLTGLVGEYAVSKQLLEWGLIDKMPSFDLEQGLSSTYDTADLIKLGFNLGCKTAGTDRAALVKENETYPEVISVYDKFQKVVYICGIATPDILKRYADLSLVTEEKVRAKAGSVAAKVGFNRFDKLIPFTKQNVERFKVDLEVEYKYFLTTEERLKIHGLTTYIEESDGKLHIRTWQGGPIFEEVDFDYPLSHTDLKKLTSIFDSKHIYLGFRITPIIEKIQSAWVGDALKIKVIDMSDVLSLRKGQYIDICRNYLTSDAYSSLTMLLKPCPPNPIYSTVNANYYMFLRELCK